MEKYRRVVDQNSASDVLPEAEHIVRVNVSGKLVNYIAYAEKKLNDSKGKVELVALGRAINRAVTVAEILRRNCTMADAEIHQLTTLRSVDLKDRYEPLEEGLRTLEMNRTMSSVSIVLAKSTDDMDTSAPGYAKPLTGEEAVSIPPEKIAEMDQERSGGGKGGGGGNGGQKSANGTPTNAAGGEQENGGKGRGKRYRNRRRGPRKDKDKAAAEKKDDSAPSPAPAANKSEAGPTNTNNDNDVTKAAPPADAPAPAASAER